MLNRTILAIALTLAVASAVQAATRQDRWMDSRNQTFAAQPAGNLLFERAKGDID